MNDGKKVRKTKMQKLEERYGKKLTFPLNIYYIFLKCIDDPVKIKANDYEYLENGSLCFYICWSGKDPSRDLVGTFTSFYYFTVKLPDDPTPQL